MEHFNVFADTDAAEVAVRVTQRNFKGLVIKLKDYNDLNPEQVFEELKSKCLQALAHDLQEGKSGILKVLTTK